MSEEALKVTPTLPKTFYLPSKAGHSPAFFFCEDNMSKKNRLPPGESGFNNLFSKYRNRATSSGRVWNLSKEEFKSLVQSTCAYCGAKPSRTHSLRGKRRDEEARKHSSFKYNGIDRLNSGEGYTLTNSVPCCWMCNQIKSDKDSRDLLKHIKKMVSYAKRKLWPERN